jgi:RNA polymerase sigma-70 factor (ECF subfamily)
MTMVAETRKADGAARAAERARIRPLIEGRTSIPKENIARTLEEVALPHLDAAYNLARWLTGNPKHAEDVVREGYLSARRLFAGFRSGDGRTWLLTIVRDTCHAWLEQNRPLTISEACDDNNSEVQDSSLDSHASLLQDTNRQLFTQALEDLPIPLRELLILRELEDLSYKQIADVTGLPVDTVMSRLSRARERLRQSLVFLVNRTLRQEKKVNSTINILAKLDGASPTQ